MRNPPVSFRQGIHATYGIDKNKSAETTYICMYVCMYVCMYICMYVCRSSWTGEGAGKIDRPGGHPEPLEALKVGSMNVKPKT
jgi:hypothetical protein